MDQGFSLKNKNIKKILKKWETILEFKSGNFVSPKKWEPCVSVCDYESELFTISPGGWMWTSALKIWS